ncbi:DUF2628 domain-containing protein [candidate division KSB1 bacterium]|nr:DUF2628 domain-containing protein [candidate division KSB1 bacterium]
MRNYNQLTQTPPEIKKWNWGAFFLNFLWGIFNKTYIALLCLVPIANIVVVFMLGVKGNEWAWKNKEWKSIEHFKKVQKKWAVWGASVFASSIIIPLLILLSINIVYPRLQNYRYNRFISQEHMRIEMEVDPQQFIKLIAYNKDSYFKEILRLTAEQAQNSSDFITVFVEKMKEKGIRLNRYLGQREQNYYEIIRDVKDEYHTASTYAATRVQDRLVDYGIKPAYVNLTDQNLIIVETSVSADTAIIKRLLCSAGCFELRFLADQPAIANAVSLLNGYLVNKISSTNDSGSKPDEQAYSALPSAIPEAFFMIDSLNPHIILYPQESNDHLAAMLDDPAVLQLIQQENNKTELLMGETKPAEPFIPLYLVYQDVVLNGSCVSDAKLKLGNRTGTATLINYAIDIYFDKDGRRALSYSLRNKYDFWLAIILDHHVLGLTNSANWNWRSSRLTINGVGISDEAKLKIALIKKANMPLKIKALTMVPASYH